MATKYRYVPTVVSHPVRRITPTRKDGLTYSGYERRKPKGKIISGFDTALHKLRKCLKCQQEFVSSDNGNRICEECNHDNQRCSKREANENSRCSHNTAQRADY